MLKEEFIARNPSHFNINPLVKLFIISEAFVWSAWNFVTPIFAVFVVNNVKGGNVEIAGFAFSIYLITRVVIELVMGKVMMKNGGAEKDKLLIAILGVFLTSIAYIGFAFSRSILLLFVFYVFLGMGLGIAAPAKYSLFSMHLDKNKEAIEWSMYDAITFIGMAMATALGGLIANEYGFQFLFILAGIVNILGALPYFIYRH